MKLSNQIIYSLAQALNEVYNTSTVVFPASIAYAILTNMEVLMTIANEIATQINSFTDVETKQNYFAEERTVDLIQCPIDTLDNISLTLQEMAAIKFMFIPSNKVGDYNVTE